MATEKQGTFLSDAESLRELVYLMPRNERDAYEGYGALQIEAAFPNRKLVVYTLKGGRPDNVIMLTTGDFSATRIGGPVVEVTDGTRTQDVGVVPTRWHSRDIFLQVPQHFELKWTGKETETGVNFVPLYALLIKTRSKEFHQVEGHTYAATLNKYRERFPQYPVRY